MNNPNRSFDIRLIFMTLLGGLIMAGSMTYAPTAEASICDGKRTVTANVVAMDQAIMFNRLGAQNINWMVYALERDVVIQNQRTDALGNPLPAKVGGVQIDDDTLLSSVIDTADPGTLQGNVALRSDKRPRPLVLRVAADECLQVNLTNLLDPQANPLNLPNPIGGQNDPILFIDNQVAGRYVSFHPLGMQLVDDANGINNDGSYVGNNANSLIAPGEARTYTYYAEAENAYMVYSRGQPFGGEASGGNVGVGLFGVVNVQPKGANFYRSKLNEEEMRLATKTAPCGSPAEADANGLCRTPKGQPVLDYEAKYPAGSPWAAEGKAGLPILNMLTAGNELVHGDIDAMIVGPNGDGSFPAATYPQANPSLPNRLQAFREFTVVFHDETGATQAFPRWFDDPVVGHTLHGVRDSFMINYGSGGIGSEIIANRLGVGPMNDCLNCAYEEFFLTAYTVGDVATLVDVPANTGLEQCDPALTMPACAALGPKANEAFYPDDPYNVHHSYTNDFVKFRNLHAGPKEQHIFHLHNHQWLFNPNDDNSNYIDAQGVGPGSGYTFEINFGGSGNRNLSAGDAIFHCHFYPHFAQGMWEMWRIADTLETGTALQVSQDGGADGIHDTPFALQSGLPAVGARALPDGEIARGVPMPAVVPLPGKPMAPMPGGNVTVKPKYVGARADGGDVGSLSVIDRDGRSPGYPFWTAGMEELVGQRPPTPPLDMLTVAKAQELAASGTCVKADPDDLTCIELWDEDILVGGAGGWDGGLPRHGLQGYMEGGESVSVQNRLDFTKVIETAKPVYYPEEGTDLEQLAMAFHAKPEHPSYALNKDGTPVAAPYVTNGMLPAPSAPYFEPCRADDGQLVEAGGSYNFYGADGLSFNAPATFGAKNPRTYKGANLQIDADLTKTGYHFSQQRILTLWGDVLDTINKVRPPEPFVMRANTMDCVKYLHANLVPEYYEMDDYQVRTPTDIIGQHIHLPKWDLVANDGSGNGWNYEDGTLSPGMVRERIHAINHFNELAAPADQVATLDGRTVLAEQPHPFADFSPANDPHWLGARTTIQRWFTDPVVNLDDEDRGLGIVFTHDHYGPSTFQQVGLYSTILAEPIGSKWSHNETGSPLGVDNDIDPTATTANGHLDGGPTSWQAIIETADGSDSWREFYFEFGDFSHAYEKGTFVGANAQGKSIVNPLTGPFVEPDHFTHSPITFEGVGGPGSEPALIVTRGPGTVGILPGHTIAPTALDGTPAPQTFLASINPSFRQEPVDQNKVFPDIVRYPPNCPHVVAGVQINDIPRPCPEAISADDPGMLTANYRAEPVGLRVYDPNKVGPDGHAGQQADGLAGDLAFALQTRTDRAIPEMNTTHGVTTYVNKLNYGVEPGDPFTPMMRTYPEDKVKIKIQSGATEHEHSATIHGIKWMQSGSGNGIAPNSGWRNAQNDGISEQFTFTAPIRNDPQKLGDSSDYAYALDAGQDGWWSGVWGLLRTYDEVRADLATLPTNEDGVVKKNRIANLDDFDGVCPINAPVKDFTVVAVAANDVLKNDVGAQLLPNDANKRDMHVGAAVDDAGGTLVYNNRDTVGQYGELHDPTAMLYVMLEDLEPQPDFAGTNQCRDRRNNIGVLNPECPVQLKANAPVEPIALRAAAGDCLKVTLHNRIPEVAYDLPGFNTLLQIVNRRVDATGSLRTFQNNLIRPSSHVGLHPQMVEYDVTRHDGTNVGLNGSEINGDTGEREFTELTTVPPVNANGDPGDPVTYTWYAGDLALVPNPDATNLCPGNGKPKNDCDLIVAATPIEFGGFNLNPADKVKQGQKGLIGTAVIEPLGSSWPTALADLEDVKDHQAAAGGTDTRKTRAQLVVTRADETTFKDASLVFQKGLNHRAGNDGTAIPNIASEGRGIPEDSHDAGQMAINYGTEPMWFRFGLAADAPFGNDPNGLGTVQNSHEAYSNNLAGAGDDPVTPIVTATAGDELRLRVTMPTGSGRGTTFQVDGHAWQRDPYVCRDDLDGYGDGDPSHNGLTGKCDPNQGYTQTGSAALDGEVGSRSIGNNPIGFVIGHQESVTPAQHFDIVPLNGAGGKGKVAGDYLYSDQGSFGPTGGLWGILRVNPEE